VTISAVFLEIDKSKQNESGINFSFFRGRDLNLGVDITGADRVSTGSGATTFFSADVNPTSPRLSVDINAALKLFESTGIGEVIARPTVTVRSGNNGRVQVGESFSVKQRTISGDVTEQFFDAGTILQVSPRVWHYKDMDFIDLSVAVERSSLVDPVNVRLSKTQASSRLFLLDGEESYVGGLFLTEDKVNREGVPILKDLPWWVFGLRYIFGYDQTISTKKELIVLLKANLVPQMENRVEEVKKGQDVLDQKLKEGREEMQKRTRKDKD
jgi:general secretion pathway protein D